MEFPYGKILEPWPDGFVPPELWPEYGDIADPPVICTRELVGGDGSPVGVRWALGPLVFEDYVSKDEPNLEASKKGRLARNRVLMWHRVGRSDTPKGWRQFSQTPWRVDGYVDLAAGDYTERWHKNARRDLRLWKSDFAPTYTIEKLDMPAYSAAYKQSLIAKRAGLDRLRALERRFDAPVKNYIDLWGIRSPEGKIVGGTGIIYSPTHKHSTHLAPFITAEGRSVFAATALIDHWFQESKRKGCPMAITINFWYPSQPKGWRGFSEFKSHFGFDFVAHPPTLYRFQRGKLF